MRFLDQHVHRGQLIIDLFIGTFSYLAWYWLEPSESGRSTILTAQIFPLARFTARAGREECDPSPRSSATQVSTEATRNHYRPG